MFLAGTDTTANALVVGTYGVLNNEAVLKKLTMELRETVPDPEDTTIMTTIKLRNLPYLVSLASKP